MPSYDVERLLEQRYYQPNETWIDLVTRVVNHVCQDESRDFKKRITRQLYDRIWLPNSPCLVNSGLKNSGLMACFVVGPTEDTLEHHVEVLGDIAAVGKRGGGAGFTGSAFRPESAPVSGSSHGFAYGPNNWALRVSDYLSMITQGGYREMALMYTLSSDHPDLDKFIGLKQNGNEKFGYNFNQSVFARDRWMAEANGQLDRIAENAWDNGDPGLLFGDTINRETPYATCDCPEITASNPCGEQPLPPFGSCNLGSINLSHEVFFRRGTFDFSVLESIVTDMTRFLDDVGSHNIFPNGKFKDWYDKHRPIGIGVMGFADALLNLGYAYGEQQGLDFLKHVMQTIQETSYRVSAELGQERGVPEHCRTANRRNITTVSIAPTGSIGFIAECSHGIEPVFSPKYQRTDERGETYLFEHPDRHQPHFRSSINPVKGLMPTWKQHVDVQVAAQSHTDSGVSKTINMVNGVTVDDVRDAMVYAWKSGAKGITIYRDGSRDTQVLDDLTEQDALEIDCPTGICDI